VADVGLAQVAFELHRAGQTILVPFVVVVQRQLLDLLL